MTRVCIRYGLPCEWPNSNTFQSDSSVGMIRIQGIRLSTVEVTLLGRWRQQRWYG